MSSLAFPHIWTPRQTWFCPECGKPRLATVRRRRSLLRRLLGPLAHLASGDVMLDTSGNVIEDASGNVLLDDGAGCTSCCGGGGTFVTCSACPSSQMPASVLLSFTSAPSLMTCFRGGAFNDSGVNGGVAYFMRYTVDNLFSSACVPMITCSGSVAPVADYHVYSHNSTSSFICINGLPTSGDDDRMAGVDLHHNSGRGYSDRFRRVGDKRGLHDGRHSE
jgi:hypothetical protein